jgi:Mg2+ and Co2+ transporter CorA
MSVNADVNINIDATTPAVQKVDDATNKINQNWVAMRNQQRAVQREFELNNRTLVRTGRLLNTVGSIVQRVISIYNTWQLLQIRNQLATKNLADAQRDLQDIFVEYGGTSREFQDGQRRVQEEHQKMIDLANENIIAYTLMVTAIIAQSGRLVTSVIPKLRSVTTAIKNVGSATGARSRCKNPFNTWWHWCRSWICRIISCTTCR